jgi:hypothetical protein
MKKTFYLILIILTLEGCASFSEINSQGLDQGVLAESRIEDRFKKGIIWKINKILPKKLKKCPIIITNVKVLRPNDDFYKAEEWTAKICQKEKVYFINKVSHERVTYSNRIAYIVMTREEKFEMEKAGLKKSFVFLDDEEFKKGFYYLEEILGDDEVEKLIEHYNNTESKCTEYKIGKRSYTHCMRVKKEPISIKENN